MTTEQQPVEATELDLKLQAAQEAATFVDQIDKFIQFHADSLALFTEQKLTWLHRACMIRGVDCVRADLGTGMRLYWATMEGEPVIDDDGEPVKEIASLQDILAISIPEGDMDHADA